MEIKGTVEGIIFRNAENGYTVTVIDVHGLEITAVGIFPPISEGEAVNLIGEYKANNKYGQQFVVQEVVVTPPNSKEGIVRYLGSGLFKGIGDVTARAIVKKFGEDTFDIIEYNPSRLTEVRGISARKMQEISSKYIELRSMQRAIMFFSHYGVSLNLSLKIYKIYGPNTESVIKTNPYRIVSEIEGVGFKTADSIAMSLGLELKDPNRIKAGIRHILDDVAGRSGHTYLPSGRVIKELVKLLAIDDCDELIQSCLEDMEFNEEIVRIAFDGCASGLMLDKYYRTETGIAKRLVKIMSEGRPLDLNLDKEIARFEKVNGITLHERQKEAVSAAINYGGVIITGGPGTGKTTIIKCIIYLFERMGISYALTAPTGRASKRMNEATGRPASTLHRLLNAARTGGKSTFVHNENNPLPQDVIIVDETSMADEFILYALLKALNHGTKLIFVGDKDQLPSVGAGCILADMITSRLIPVVELTHIYRQAEGSYIISNAHLINKCILPDPAKDSKDFFFDYQEDENVAKDHVLQFVTTRLPKYLNVSAEDIQVLAPLKVGTAGVNELNKALQTSINPPSRDKTEITVGMQVFRTGDRVIQMANNYDIEWTRVQNGEITNGEGVFNGDIGKIIEINKGEMTVTVQFEDDRVAVYSAEDIDQLSLSYCISVHKSQGSEFKAVVLVVSRYNPMVLSKNLFYTAVTRAKDLVVIVGNKDSVARMSKNRYTEKRLTALVNFIQEELSAQ